MAELPDDPSIPIDLNVLAQQLGAGLLQAFIDGKLDHAAVASVAKSATVVKELAYETAVDEAARLGELMHTLEGILLPFIGAFVAPIVGGLFGAEGNPSDFARRVGRGGGLAAAQSIVDGLLKAIAGDGAGEIEPSMDGARRIATAATQASLESSLNALVPEIVSDFLPFDLGKITALLELPEGIIRSLGVGRLVRRALTPIVNATCTTPATWHVNKLYRPALLGPSTIAKIIARNPDDRDYWLEHLRRQGYSEPAIDELLSEQAKFLSVADVDMLVRGGQWSEEEALANLTDQGYEDGVARNTLLVRKLTQINGFDREMADAGVGGYVAGRLTEGDLGGYLNGTTITDREKAQYVEVAKARRIAARRDVTPSEAAQLVKAGILGFSDYRAALVRDGRTDRAVDALELLLHKEIDDKADVEALRQHQAEQRAAEKQQREAEAAARRAEADAKLALSKRGRISDLEQAYIRGLLPIGRVEDVYSATYDPDTVDTLVALVESRRADYVAQQAAAAAAKTRAATRGIDVGQLEQAVLAGVLTVDEFARHLGDLKFSDGDAALLTATVAAKLDAHRAADAAHDAAVAAAKVKHVDLATVEMLVRRGHTTIDGYRRILDALGYDDIAQAALVERLQILIDDDAAAAKTRAAAAARLANKGLSLDQFRRAVTLGIVPIDNYAPFLLKNGFNTDAVAVLVPELQADVDEAAAAQRRRDTADRRMQAGTIPLADLRRAARLGLIPVDVYFARLTREGYTADEVAIESDLLAVEIGADKGAATRAAAAEGSTHVPGLTLTQLARAVRLGEASLDQYAARALAIGLTQDDAGILARVLQSEIATAAAAAQRKQELAAAGPARELARADVAKGVMDGLRTVDDYGAWLSEQGYADDDAALLVAELEFALDAKAAKAAGGQ